MGFRWRKSFSIFPGFRLNLSHRGARGQLGGSPLSFSFRLFGGSKQRRVTASLPGTGLSFVTTSNPDERPPAREDAGPLDHKSALVEAMSQAAQFRLLPLALVEVADQSPELRREIVSATLPIFVRIMAARGATAKHPDASIDDWPLEKVDALIEEVTGRRPAVIGRLLGRYPHARGAAARLSRG